MALGKLGILFMILLAANSLSVPKATHLAREGDIFGNQNVGTAFREEFKGKDLVDILGSNGWYGSGIGVFGFGTEDDHI